MQQAAKILIILFYLLSAGSEIRAQVSEKAGNSVIDSLKRQPPFTIYGDNYIITGTNIGNKTTASHSDAKFQFGFKQLLAEFDGFYQSFLFFTYRQITFWDIYQKSFPFRASNYNPSLVLGKMLLKNSSPAGGIWFSLEHESNGLSGEDSRGWNFFSFKYSTKISNGWYGSIQGWAPIGALNGEEDLLDYKSYFEGGLTYYPTEKLIFESAFRRSFTKEWLGKIMLSANYRLSKHKNQFIYLQYYNGYAESLIDYQRHVHMIRVGITFKDLSWLVFE
jgi:phospholipase A1